MSKMPEENEYEIEEGDTTQYFHVIEKNGKMFTVERRHYAAQDFVDAYISDENGWPIYPKEKRYKQIRVAVSKYVEQQEHETEFCKSALNEIYEKYEHMDKVLSDTGLLDLAENDFRMSILYELWAAIKVALNNRGDDKNADK